MIILEVEKCKYSDSSVFEEWTRTHRNLKWTWFCNRFRPSNIPDRSTFLNFPDHSWPFLSFSSLESVKKYYETVENVQRSRTVNGCKAKRSTTPRNVRDGKFINALERKVHTSKTNESLYNLWHAYFRKFIKFNFLNYYMKYLKNINK